MSAENGWAEYSKLVLKELATLATGIKELNESLQDVKQEITAMKAKDDKVHDLITWKGRIDEVTSPTQLKELQLQVEDLKLFKTKAITVFAVVQFIMAAILFAKDLL